MLGIVRHSTNKYVYCPTPKLNSKASLIPYEEINKQARVLENTQTELQSKPYAETFLNLNTCGVTLHSANYSLLLFF